MRETLNQVLARVGWRTKNAEHGRKHVYAGAVGAGAYLGELTASETWAALRAARLVSPSAG